MGEAAKIQKGNVHTSLYSKTNIIGIVSLYVWFREGNIKANKYACIPPACCPYLPACTVQGGVCSGGVCSGGVSACGLGGEGVSAFNAGGVSQHALGQTVPCSPVDRQTLVKT